MKLIAAAIIRSFKPITNFQKLVLKPADICNHNTSTSVSSLASLKRWTLQNSTWLKYWYFPDKGFVKFFGVLRCIVKHIYSPRFHPNIQYYGKVSFHIWTTISRCRSRGLRMRQKQQGFSLSPGHLSVHAMLSRFIRSFCYLLWTSGTVFL